MKLESCPFCGCKDIRVVDHGKIGRYPHHYGDNVNRYRKVA